MLRRFLGPILCLCWLIPVEAQSQVPDTLWFRYFGGAYSDEGWQVQETVDGGLIVVGSGMSNFGDWDIYLIKTDADGNLVWTRTFGGPNTDRGSAIRQTSDGGFIVVGWQRASPQSEKEICLLKTDSNGNLLWSRTYSEFQKQEARSIGLAPDGGYVIAGWVTEMPIFEDIFIMKTDSLGNVIWSRNYGGDDSDKPWSVKNTSDGSYIIAGWTDIFPRGSDMYLIKTDQNGDSLWTRKYGSPYNDIATSVLETSDHRYIVGGCVGANFYERHAALLYLDENGDSINTVLLPFTEIHSMELTMDGGLIVAGSLSDSLTTAFVTKTNIDGQEIWASTFPPGSDVSCYIYSVIQTSDSGYVLTGVTQAYPENMILAKLSAEQTSIGDIEGPKLPKGITLAQNYPNPFNSATKIKFELARPAIVTIEIFDILGRRIEILFEGFLQSGNHQVVWDAGKHSSGIYFYRVRAGHDSLIRRMVYLK